MQDINDIKNVINLPILTNLEKIVLLSVTVALVFLLIIFFLYKPIKKYFIKNKKINKKIEPLPEEKKDYNRIAVLKIKELKNLIDLDEFKKFYNELSKTVKYYLGKQYNFKALDMTSSEIIKYNNLSKFIRPKIKYFFSILKQKQFSGRKTKKEEAIAVFEAALKIFN